MTYNLYPTGFVLMPSKDTNIGMRSQLRTLWDGKTLLLGMNPIWRSKTRYEHCGGAWTAPHQSDSHWWLANRQRSRLGACTQSHVKSSILSFWAGWSRWISLIILQRQSRESFLFQIRDYLFRENLFQICDYLCLRILKNHSLWKGSRGFGKEKVVASKGSCGSGKISNPRFLLCNFSIEIQKGLLWFDG